MTIRGTGVKGFAKGKAYVIADQENPFENIPEGGVVLVAKDISLEDSAAIDFSKVVGIVTEEGDAASQVCVIARGTGVPAIVGVEGCLKEIVSGDRLLIQNYDVVINPDLDSVNEFERLRTSSDSQLSLDL